MSTPVDGSSRQYLRIRPTQDSLATDRLAAQCAQLHGALRDATVEWLLVADPAADEVAYYVSLPTDTRRSIERILRRIAPDYPIERVDDPLGDTRLDDPDGQVAATRFRGVGKGPQDWMTRLRPAAYSDAPAQHETARVEQAPDLPLESVVEGMADADGLVVYQALVTPREDWSYEASARVNRLDDERDTWWDRRLNSLEEAVSNIGPPPERRTHEGRSRTPDRSQSRPHREPTQGGGRGPDRGKVPSDPGSRVAGILAKSDNASFDVNARVVAAGSDAEAIATDLGSTFTAIGGDYYRVSPSTLTGDDVRSLAAAVRDRECEEPGWWERVTDNLQLTMTNSPAIVADSTTVAHFCLLDGATLTRRARRAMGAVRADRSPLAPPSDRILDHYTGEGMALGELVLQDGTTTGTVITLPPALQPLHAGLIGKSGAGKSVALQNLITANHAATDGADIAFLPKGGSMAVDLLRAHHATHGDLENVYYFDCSEVVPALSFFSLEDQLADGVSRAAAITDIADHLLDILRAVDESERLDEAIQAPDVIQYLVKALFDEVHGDDAYTYRDLQRAATEMAEFRTPPDVSDPDLQELLDSVVRADDRVFDAVMSGVASRLNKIPTNDVLAPMFNHVPDADDPAFDFANVLNEDALVIFDTGTLRSTTQSAFTRVLLSQLWTALRRRTEQHADPPLVNLYLEEAASLAGSEILSELFSQGREFGLSITLTVQYPKQLEAADEATYLEVMNDVSTIVTGNVADDARLEKRLASKELSPEDVGNRLRALSRGQWFASLPAPFKEEKPKTFMLESLPLPPGHPDGDAPLSDAREAAFQARLALCRTGTAVRHGLAIGGEPAAQPVASKTADVEPSQDGETVLSRTTRFPSVIDYNEAADANECGECHSRYAASVDGLRAAIECCASLDRVDRDDVPITGVDLRLTEAEIAASDYTRWQLAFVQAVYTAMQRGFDEALEYDITRDSMLRLREYCGLAADDVDALVDGGLLRKDGDHPHRLYSVTPDGRNEIQVPHREGDAWGDGEGDVSESSRHVVMVLDGCRFIEQEYAQDPESAVVEAVSYYEDGEHRLDAVGLDSDGNVVVTLEAERSNNDLRRAVPADYDKMAVYDPEAAIWVVESEPKSHDVLQALNDPATGEVRVEKTYSENTPPHRFTFDAAGCTAMKTHTQVRNQLASD